MKKEYIHTALIALVAFAVTKYVQQNVVKIPVVGGFLPGGGATAA